jgi:threonine aldolase
MLQAMIQAPVGDDVFGEDPTVNALEARVADMFGMESGLFVSSGTLGNQLCLHILTHPGEEVIIDELGHIFNYETAAAAHLSSLQLRPLRGNRGKLTPELVHTAVRPGHDWDPISRVLALENTTNKGGGAFYTASELAELKACADANKLKLHIDGARIWNAITASGIQPSFFGSIADTLSVCFSKGLGAPVGSMILSTKERIQRARRIRKMWGGGMRQVGLLAAAADFALDQVWPLLAMDHRRAKQLAQVLNASSYFEIDPESVFTNIVLFKVVKGTVEDTLTRFASHGIGMTAFGPQIIRATFHYQITDIDLETITAVVQSEFPS